MSMAFICDNNKFWTVVINNKSYQFDKSHEKYELLVEYIKKEDEEQFLKDFDTTTNLNVWGEGSFKVVGGVLKYGDEDVHPVLSERILEMIEQGFSYKFMLRFVERLYNNPSHRAVNELYNFLSHEHLPITTDGHFLAYKAVTKDFKDKRTRTVDNSVGSEPSMSRHKVDDNWGIHCSQGFHIGSLEYATNFMSEDDVIIICQIDPSDVVSVPNEDCNKMRCCRYKVVGLYEGAMGGAVVDKYSEEKVKGPEEDIEEEEGEFEEENDGYDWDSWPLEDDDDDDDDDDDEDNDPDPF